jgi:hypothetical protein
MLSLMEHLSGLNPKPGPGVLCQADDLVSVEGPGGRVPMAVVWGGAGAGALVVVVVAAGLTDAGACRFKIDAYVTAGCGPVVVIPCWRCDVAVVAAAGGAFSPCDFGGSGGGGGGGGSCRSTGTIGGEVGGILVAAGVMLVALGLPPPVLDLALCLGFMVSVAASFIITTVCRSGCCGC